MHAIRDVLCLIISVLLGCVIFSWRRRKPPYYDLDNPKFPCRCDLCKHVIEDGEDDLMWHGYGNCTEIPEELMEEITKGEKQDGEKTE